MIDLLLHTLSQSYKVCGYVDDLLIIIEGQSGAELKRCVEQAINISGELGQHVGVELSAEHERPPLTRSRGSGIIVSERMNFLFQIKYVNEKLLAVVGKVERVLRSD